MGVSVTIVQRPKQLLAPLDADMASFVHAEMRRHGVTLRLGETVTGFRQDGDSVLTLLEESEPLHSDNATYKALMRATISEALGLNGNPEEVEMSNSRDNSSSGQSRYPRSSRQSIRKRHSRSNSSSTSFI